MIRSHRICLKPTAEQESLFLQHAGFARFAYNWAVGEFKAGLDVGEWLSESYAPLDGVETTLGLPPTGAAQRPAFLGTLPATQFT